jgi:hypothetical protein
LGYRLQKAVLKGNQVQNLNCTRSCKSVFVALWRDNQTLFIILSLIIFLKMERKCREDGKKPISQKTCLNCIRFKKTCGKTGAELTLVCITT